MRSLKLADFPLQTYDKIRYADTDRQGHVNNAVFSTFLETGRVEFLYNPAFAAGAGFVIASLQLNFVKEITWPGTVEIGTGILKVGNSSIRIFQCIFQQEQCVANAETVIVQVDTTSGKSKPISDTARTTLEQWLLQDVDV